MIIISNKMMTIFIKPIHLEEKYLVYFKLPRIRVHLFNYVFSPGWIPTLATLFFLFLFIHLGVWQIHRAEQKRHIEKDFTRHTYFSSINSLRDSPQSELRYQHLQITGYFDNRHLIFLDNKTYHQMVGYHVFSPFIIPNQKKTLLVDRGFVAIKSRKVLPNIPLVQGLQTIDGLIYFPHKSFLLKRDQINQQWPLTLQQIDVNLIENALHQKIYPFYLLLQSEDGSMLIRDWHAVVLPASRHTGYAIQWFLLALTLMVIYLTLNLSRANK